MSPIPPDPDPTPPDVQIPATGFQVRGIVVDGETAAIGQAFGVLIIRLGMLAAFAVLTWVYQDQIAAGMVSLLIAWILPVIVVLVILGWLASRLGGSCLGSLLGGAIFRGMSGRRAERADGWELFIATNAGVVPVRVPAMIPFDGGEEVVVSGPNIGGVKQAWLIQVLSPGRTTRIGRGLIGTLLTLCIVIPIVVILLTL